MLGDKQHIAESGVACGAHPLLAVEFRRVVESGGVFALRPFETVECVHAEMHEHAVAAFSHLFWQEFSFCEGGMLSPWSDIADNDTIADSRILVRFMVMVMMCLFLRVWRPTVPVAVFSPGRVLSVCMKLVRTDS